MTQDWDPTLDRHELLKRGLQVGAAIGVTGLGGLTAVDTAVAADTAWPSVNPAAAAGWKPSPTPLKKRQYLWENLAAGQKAPRTKYKVRTIGLGVSVQDRFLREFERRTGHKASGEVTTLTTMITKWLGGAYKNYDTEETNANRNAALWDAKLLNAIPVGQVIPWSYARDLFTSKKALGYNARNGWPLKEIWVDPNNQKEFRLVPQFYNCDSIAYRIDLIKKAGIVIPGTVTSDGDVTSWGALVDPKFKGQSAILNDSLLTPGWCAGYMAYNKIAHIKNTADMTNKEVDTVIQFLIKRKKAGQFRVIWEDYGQCVNLLAAGEVLVADAWNPVVEDVKKQNVPCKYAFPKEGYTAWFHGVAIRKDTPNLPAALDYVNFCLEGWWGAQVATQGYYSPTKTSDAYLRTYHRTSKKYNDHQWWYQGGSSPNPKKGWPITGRDGGAYERRWSNIMHWMVWPKNPDYYAQRWNDFLAA